MTTTSWKTSVGGTLLALGVAAQGLPSEPAWMATLKVVALMVAAAGGLAIGIFGADHSAMIEKSSTVKLDAAGDGRVLREGDAVKLDEPKDPS